jgi:hypothetical protein
MSSNDEELPYSFNDDKGNPMHPTQQLHSWQEKQSKPRWIIIEHLVLDLELHHFLSPEF